MARCKRCGIEFRTGRGEAPEFCEGCVEDLLDEEYDDDEKTFVNEFGLPDFDWMMGESDQRRDKRA